MVTPQMHEEADAVDLLYILDSVVGGSCVLWIGSGSVSFHVWSWDWRL